MSVKIIALPDLGEGVTEGEILKIKVKAGDSIVMDQALVEVMTDKASMEVPSSIEGLVESVEVSEGDMVSVGAPLFKIKTEGEDSAVEEEESSVDARYAGVGGQEGSPADRKASGQDDADEVTDSHDKVEGELSSKGGGKDSVLALPATRKLAKDLGINLKEIPLKSGSQKITREDLLEYIKKRLHSGIAPSASSIASSKLEKNFEVTKSRLSEGLND